MVQNVLRVFFFGERPNFVVVGANVLPIFLRGENVLPNLFPGANVQGKMSGRKRPSICPRSKRPLKNDHKGQ